MRSIHDLRLQRRYDDVVIPGSDSANLEPAVQ